MARGDWDHFERWANEHALDYRAPDVQDVYYTWIEIFSSTPMADADNQQAFYDFLIYSGYTEEEAQDIVDTYTEDAG